MLRSYKLALTLDNIASRAEPLWCRCKDGSERLHHRHRHHRKIFQGKAVLPAHLHWDYWSHVTITDWKRISLESKTLVILQIWSGQPSWQIRSSWEHLDISKEQLLMNFEKKNKYFVVNLQFLNTIFFLINKINKYVVPKRPLYFKISAASEIYFFI